MRFAVEGKGVVGISDALWDVIAMRKATKQIRSVQVQRWIASLALAMRRKTNHGVPAARIAPELLAGPALEKVRAQGKPSAKLHP